MKTHAISALMASVGLLLPSGVTLAGDRDWATAGKVLTGIVAADVLFHRLPAWRESRQSNSLNTCRIVKDPPPPPFYTFPRPDERYEYELPAPAAAPPATPREELPPPLAAGGTAVAKDEEPAVIHQFSPVKRVYQPRIQGHKAYVQERVSPNHPWITVAEYPSIW